MSGPGELTAVPVPSPGGRWGEYTLLSRQVKQAGLLERRPSPLRGVGAGPRGWSPWCPGWSSSRPPKHPWGPPRRAPWL